MKKIILTIKKASSLFFVTLILLGIIFLQSCEKQIIEESDLISDVNDANYIVQDGYLVFKTFETFLNITDEISNLSDKERTEWETKIGFMSQRRIVNTIIEEEIKIDEINEEKYAGMNIENIDRDEFHSTAYNYYINKGVIKIINKGTDDEYWDYSVFNRSFVNFINEDGLFAIGDTLYQATEKSLKAMTKTDLNNTYTLINAVEPDKKNNIFFLHNETNLKTFAQSPGLIPNHWVSDGKRRVKIEIYLAVRAYWPSNMRYDFYHEVYVQCQEKNWLGQWKYKFAEVWVDGSWTIQLYKYPEYYSNSWSYNGSVSYLKASINPQTGNSAPYQSYFSVLPQDPWNQNLPWYDGDQYDCQPIFTNYNWWALRTYYIEATLNKMINRFLQKKSFPCHSESFYLFQL
jgi:hypothetical protein